MFCNGHTVHVASANTGHQEGGGGVRAERPGTADAQRQPRPDRHGLGCHTEFPAKPHVWVTVHGAAHAAGSLRELT